MVIKAFIDTVEDLACTEQAGVIRKLTRKARVKGVFRVDLVEDGENPEDVPAIRVLTTALAATPLPGTRLGEDGYEMLIVASRSAKMVSDDEIAMVDVLLNYVHVLDCDCQIIGFGNVVYGRMRTSLQQVPTNLQRVVFDPNTEEERFNVPIVLSHTFPDGTPNFFYLDPITGEKVTETKDRDHPGERFTQGGEVTVSTPMSNYQFTGLITTFDPQAVSDKVKGKINKFPILPRDEEFDEDGNLLGVGIWLCQEVHWEVNKAPFIDNNDHNNDRSGVYKFSFEFQENPDGWDPQAVFVDDRTKRPPPGLLVIDEKGNVVNKQIPLGRAGDIGAMTAQEYEKVDFEKELNCWFEIAEET